MPFPFDIIDHGVMAFFSKFARSSEVMNRVIVKGMDLEHVAFRLPHILPR